MSGQPRPARSTASTGCRAPTCCTAPATAAPSTPPRTRSRCGSGCSPTPKDTSRDPSPTRSREGTAHEPSYEAELVVEPQGVRRRRRARPHPAPSAGRASCPAWEPGAHIDVVLGPGAGAAVLAVRRPGRPARPGGSRCCGSPTGAADPPMCTSSWAQGDKVRVRGPRNHFALQPAPRYLFVAGGIGITPILPMLAAAEAAGAEWTLLYGGRTRASMAFAEELGRYGDRVAIAPQDETGLLDLAAVLDDVRDGHPRLLLRSRAAAGRGGGSACPAGVAARRAVPAQGRKAGRGHGVRGRAGAERPDAHRARRTSPCSTPCAPPGSRCCSPAPRAPAAPARPTSSTAPGPPGLGAHRRGAGGRRDDDHLRVPVPWEAARARTCAIREVGLDPGDRGQQMRQQVTAYRVDRGAAGVHGDVHAATTSPSRSRTGAATERSPSSSSWSTMAYPCRRTRRSSARSRSARDDRAGGQGRQLRAGEPGFDLLSGRWARITRPTEVTWAGKRVPTVIVAVMMRRVGHPRHVHDVVAVEDAQGRRLPYCATSCSRCGSAISRQGETGQVGVAEFQDARGEPEQPAVRRGRIRGRRGSAGSGGRRRGSGRRCGRPR